MNDNELKAIALNTVKNGVIVLITAATVVALYYLSRSWHALWSLILLGACSSLKTGKAAEIEAQAELEEARRDE